MTTPNKCLLIGSSEPYSGKTATLLGLASQLQARQIDFSYGKPIGTCFDEASKTSGSQTSEDCVDEDVAFLIDHLGLSSERVLPTSITLDSDTVRKRLCGDDRTDYATRIAEAATAGSGWGLLEGAGSLVEGELFDISTAQLAEKLDAPVMLVIRYRMGTFVDSLLAAKAMLGDRLVGVAINDVPIEAMDEMHDCIIPFLESRQISVFGTIPLSPLLSSISVAEIVQKLEAQVLCGNDRLDLMVETLQVGAMSVNSAIKYFQNARNSAIVTGGDRADIQLAALETATHCLILTGHRLTPPAMVLNRAEEVEIPVLSVELDTLTTIERIDAMFGQMRLQEPAKVQFIKQLIGEHFDLERLLASL